jgi:hypothetical protein
VKTVQNVDGEILKGKYHLERHVFDRTEMFKCALVNAMWGQAVD